MATLDDRQQMLLMAYADGQLDAVADADDFAEVQALLASSMSTQAELLGLQTMRQAVGQAAFAPVELSARMADELSMVRGRVLTKLPLQARVQATPGLAEAAGQGWLAAVSWGRLAFGLGSVAAAVLLVLALRSPHQGALDDAPAGGEVAADQRIEAIGEQPGVIIEEMEIDSGTILVDPATDRDGPVIIWHLDGPSPDDTPAGSGLEDTPTDTDPLNQEGVEPVEEGAG